MKRLICITGPTAIGKTTLSIQLAQRLHTEIISADSRQFYKEMYIGTAVPESQELNAVKHHFIQHISIHESYDAAQFEIDALRKLDTLFQQYNDVILVGGSGLYIDALVKGLDDFPEVSGEIKEALQTDLKQKGLAFLQEELKTLDPVSYQEIDIHNPRRVLRALEICRSTGKAYSSFKRHSPKKRSFKTLWVGLEAPREIIYERINKRVDIMMQNGLLKEVEKLYPYRHLKALQTVGYKELFQYIEGTWSLEFAVSEIKKNTRRYAKRQLTWFRKNPDIQWFNISTDVDTFIDKLITNKT